MAQSVSISPRAAGAGTGPGPVGAVPAAGQARLLLAAGALAGPLFVIVVLVQAFTRPGFDLTRDAASLLDLGPWGWVQVTSFIVTGLLFTAAAAGLRRTVRTGPGRTWLPRLLVITGAGFAGGGIFRPDPAGGFPPGTPAHAAVSWHGIGHEVCGSAAFLALIAANLVLARRYRAARNRGAAACSLAAGVLCAAGVASGGAPHGSLTLFTGVSIALLWTAAALGHLTAQQPAIPAPPGAHHD